MQPELVLYSLPLPISVGLSQYRITRAMYYVRLHAHSWRFLIYIEQPRNFLHSLFNLNPSALLPD